MSNIEKLCFDIALARRELKNIRQESMRQKAEIKSEISKIQAFLMGNVEKEGQEKGLTEKSKETSICKVNETIEDKSRMIPIGYVSSCFKTKNGIPRQPSLCPSAKGTLTIEKSVFNNPEHALIGLEEFSHIWLLFVFHDNDGCSIKSKVHPPRLEGASVGVFSTRSPHRPSPIGLSLTKLDKIEGSTLYLSGIDLLDGTPVLDIKPYIPLYDMPTNHNRPGNDHTKNNDTCEDIPPEISNFTSLQNYHNATPNCNVAPYLAKLTHNLEVVFTNRALKDLEYIQMQQQSNGNPAQAITEVLQNDPRSVYRRQKCSDRLYYFCNNNLHVTCWFDDNIAEVLRVKYKNDEIIK